MVICSESDDSVSTKRTVGVDLEVCWDEDDGCWATVDVEVDVAVDFHVGLLLNEDGVDVECCFFGQLGSYD